MTWSRSWLTFHKYSYQVWIVPSFLLQTSGGVGTLSERPWSTYVRVNRSAGYAVYHDR